MTKLFVPITSAKLNECIKNEMIEHLITVANCKRCNQYEERDKALSRISKVSFSQFFITFVYLP